MRPFILIAFAAGTASAAEPPTTAAGAPPLAFEQGDVLADGHVIAADTILPPQPGPVSLRTREGDVLHWQITVENGETQLVQPNGRWAAKAEYTRTQRGGHVVCQIYQTYWSPVWAVRRGGAAPQPHYGPADDRIYVFRDAPCP